MEKFEIWLNLSPKEIAKLIGQSPLVHARASSDTILHFHFWRAQVKNFFGLYYPERQEWGSKSLLEVSYKH